MITWTRFLVPSRSTRIIRNKILQSPKCISFNKLRYPERQRTRQRKFLFSFLALLGKTFKFEAEEGVAFALLIALLLVAELRVTLLLVARLRFGG